MYPVEDHSNWMKFYPDTREEIPKDLPTEKGQESGCPFIYTLTMQMM
jgi:hypothetical protein